VNASFAFGICTSIDASDDGAKLGAPTVVII
jgi:hypothetical protein